MLATIINAIILWVLEKNYIIMKAISGSCRNVSDEKRRENCYRDTGELQSRKAP